MADMRLRKVVKKIREKTIAEVLELYSAGELSASRACEILGIPKAAFYDLLAEKNIPLPEKLNESILHEISIA